MDGSRRGDWTAGLEDEGFDLVVDLRNALFGNIVFCRGCAKAAVIDGIVLTAAQSITAVFIGSIPCGFGTDKLS